MELPLPRRCLLALLVIAYCTSIVALDKSESRVSYETSSIDDPRRPSSQQHHHPHPHKTRLARRLSSRHNEIGSTKDHISKKTTSRLATTSTTTTTTTTTPVTTLKDKTDSESTFDDGLLLSSAGNGKERKTTTSMTSSTSTSDDDDKKTLSQQVKEGKYGLIQNEIFAVRPKRPGILSYASNPEVPGDTIKNFGGLDEEEIWLAENHVLVLKGGSFPEEDAPTEQIDNSWPPIDNYKAPRRQVKIPPRPKVPPPFPVQLNDNEPIQILSANGSSIYATENNSSDYEGLPGGFRGFLPGEGPYFPFPGANGTDLGPEKKNKAEGGLGPFYPALPPGAVIVPPPNNQSDYDDEDQSIYYPPPYSFVYPQDNSTDIPPGPLVPGIILPPPPDFFSSLDDSKSTTKDKFSNKRPIVITTPLSSNRGSFLPPRKSSTKLYKTGAVTSTPIGSKTLTYNSKPFGRSKLKNATYHQYQSEKTITPLPPKAYHSIPFVEVTTPTPIKSTTIKSPDKFHIQQILGNQVIESSTEKPWKAVVSSKAVPLVTFFASTTPSSVDQPVETTPSSVKNILTTENPTHYPSQASYYFYEENNNEETPSTTQEPVIFFSTTAESPPYFKIEIPEQPAQGGEKKPEYLDVEMIPSQQTSKDYNVKLLDSIIKDQQIFRYLDSGATNGDDNKFEPSPVRNQSPRMLHSEPLYYQPIPTRSSPKLSYFTTPKPKTYYRKPEIGEGFESFEKSKSKPIYQYSFEATNYSKRGRQALSQKPLDIEEHSIQQPIQQSTRQQKEFPLFNEFQDIQNVADQYDYEGSEPVINQQVQTAKSYLNGSKKKERTYFQQSTTSSPIRDTTLAAHQQYFTKQDEQLLDDVTKEYFTMFGKKLSSGKLPSTTPIYGKSSVTERPTFTNNVNSFGTNEFAARPVHTSNAYRTPNIKVHYGDQTPGPYSLKDDIVINFKHPLPAINPDSEYISRPSAAQLIQTYGSRPIVPIESKIRDYVPSVRHRYEQIQRFGSQAQSQQQTVPQEPNSFVPIADPRQSLRGAFPSRPVSLEGDVDVNYKHPRPPVNPDAEFISTGLPSRIDAGKQPNSYFAYRLPGDGGHFYFLTPQAINREDANGGFLYPRPRGARLLRRRRGRDND